MGKQKVAFTHVRETMLLTLMGKARESQRPASILRDTFAAAAMAQIDYDFARLRPRRAADIILALRARIFDEVTQTFLRAHPAATVVHMACGLDSRVYRIDPSADVRWIDVDFPDTIALREKLYPSRPGYQMIGTSLTDLDWLAAIPADRPTLLMAEGLTPYLEPAEGSALFAALATRFPAAELVIDIYSRLGCRLAMLEGTVSATGARMPWGIDDQHELTEVMPGFAFVEELAGYRPEMAQLGWPTAPFFRLALSLPIVRSMGRIVRFTGSPAV
jgi:O-methyltransferase involved in polyketide biosynthesis